MSSDNESCNLIVIGAGLMRTGTHSLKLALERLLGGKCYHMKEITSYPSHIKLWIKAVDQGNLSQEEWRYIFKDFCATVDHPSCLFYVQLLRVYPNAKIILTVREPHSWVNSVRNSVMLANLAANQFPVSWITYFTPFRYLGRMLNKCGTIAGIEEDDKGSVKKFNDWIEHVKASVPSDRILIFEAQMGWKPLCEFLDIPIPDEPYPNVNSTRDMIKNIKNHQRNCYLVLFGISIISSFLLFWIYKYCFV